MSIMVSLQPIGRGVVRRVPLWFGVRRDFLQKKLHKNFFIPKNISTFAPSKTKTATVAQLVRAADS